VAALRSFETVDAMGRERNELVGRHALLPASALALLRRFRLRVERAETLDAPRPGASCDWYAVGRRVSAHPSRGW